MSVPKESVWLESWPIVPAEDRPKKLWVNYSTSQELREMLLERGWEVQDVRLMADPLESLKATLEGIRLGSIKPDNAMYKFLDLEVKLRTKVEDPEESTEQLPLDAIINSFNTGAPIWQKDERTTITIPAATGRPVGSKDSAPRDTAGYQELRGVALRKKQQKND